MLQPSKEIALGGLNDDAALRKEVAVEVAKIGGNEGGGAAGERGGALDPVIGIGTGHRLNHRLVVLGCDPPGRKGLPDGAGDRTGLLGCAVPLSDDDALPLLQQEVAPEEVVVEVLGHRQQQVHQRHREQDVGVQIETLDGEPAQVSARSASSTARRNASTPARRRSRSA